MNLDDLNLGQLYAMRDKLRAKIDLRNGGVQERASLLAVNKQIALTEAGRSADAVVIVPSVLRYKPRSVWS